MSFRVVHRPLATSFFFGLFAHSHTSSKRRRDAVKKETDLFVPFSRSFRFFRLFFSTFRVADCSALRNRTARLATSRDTFARALFDRRSARLSGSVRAKNFGFRVSVDTCSRCVRRSRGRAFGFAPFPRGPEKTDRRWCRVPATAPVTTAIPVLATEGSGGGRRGCQTVTHDCPNVARRGP